MTRAEILARHNARLVELETAAKSGQMSVGVAIGFASASAWDAAREMFDATDTREPVVSESESAVKP